MEQIFTRMYSLGLEIRAFHHPVLFTWRLLSHSCSSMPGNSALTKQAAHGAKRQIFIEVLQEPASVLNFFNEACRSVGIYRYQTNGSFLNHLLYGKKYSDS